MTHPAEDELPDEVRQFIELARANGAEVEIMAVTQPMLDDLLPDAKKVFEEYLQATANLLDEKPDVNEQDLTISLMQEFMAPGDIPMASALVGNTLLAAVCIIQAAKMKLGKRG